METAAYFLEKAAQCRRLAANIVGDRSHDGLIKLAEEFEAKAAAYTARERAALAIGVGDDVSPISPSPQSAEDAGEK
jgi:hypothetical protein